MLNKVILIGRICTDLELKYTPAGIEVCTFRLAVDRQQSAESRQAGEEKQADFVDIVAWRKQAIFLRDYCAKGRLMAIDGRLQIRSYVATDGTNRRVTEVVAESIKALEWAKRDAEAAPAAA